MGEWSRTHRIWENTALGKKISFKKNIVIPLGQPTVAGHSSIHNNTVSFRLLCEDGILESVIVMSKIF